MSVSVGIDLGTTFSAVACIDPKTNLPKIVPNGEGEKLTPSVIQFVDDEAVFGSEAEEAYNAGIENCVATFKRQMGSTEPYCHIGGKAYTSEDLSAMLLRHLKEEAEAALGDVIKEAVITVPAYFYSTHREATLRAAERAGLKVKKIIDEPNAAALCYGLDHWRENANILVYDLGGGTFDVTLARMEKGGVLSTIATRGNHILGGRDWDKRIENILISKLEDETGLDIKNDPELSAMVKGMSEGVKRRLSAMPTAKLSAQLPGYGKAEVTITKGEFEEASADLLDRTGSLCLAVLEEAGLSKSDVTDILLVGGSTRMPQVSAFLEEMFGKKPLSHVNPDEAVALGAAIQASKGEDSYAALQVQVVDGRKVTDRSASNLSSSLSVGAERRLDGIGLLSLRETTAHALGVIAINDEEKRYYNEIIIPANHPRPVRAAKKFRFPGNDGKLLIYVLQGDKENPAECQITHKYVMSGIRHSGNDKYGTLMRIQYSYDTNGVIHVQARQDEETRDLPIRREDLTEADDISRFGRPVSDGGGKRKFGSILQMGGGGGHSVAHKYKAITFSNVEWQKYDNISLHPSGAEFGEPHKHVIANEKMIRFVGYNVSEMDEGVYYEIGPEDDFEIECDIDTSTVMPHPGGYLQITLGVISAQLNQDGGEILMNNSRKAKVPSRFHLKMSLADGGKYEVEVDGKVVGTSFSQSSSSVDVRFGFVHGEHCCHLRSDASVSDIQMRQSSGGDDNPDAETWDD